MKVEYTNKFTLLDLSNAEYARHAQQKSASFYDQTVGTES